MGAVDHVLVAVQNRFYASEDPNASESLGARVADELMQAWQCFARKKLDQYQLKN